MMLVRVLFSTCLVLGLIWYVARTIRQPKGVLAKLRLPSSTSMVESRAALNRTTSLAVIRFGHERILVAANDTTVQVLATDPVEGAAPRSAPAAPAAADESANESHTEPFSVAPAAEIEEAPTPIATEEVLAVQEMLEPSHTSLVEVLRGLTIRTVGDKR
jgi:hypothetical protein